jgi:hypothetical protein
MCNCRPLQPLQRSAGYQSILRSLQAHCVCALLLLQQNGICSDRLLLLQVLARVIVKGKAYTNASSGCVAVPSLLFDAVLEYVPQSPKERLMGVDYTAAA